MIAPQTIKEVSDRVEIYDVISPTVALKKVGNDWQARCPFHAENSPSFRVSVSRNRYKCFGCGEGGDAIAFLIKQDHLTFNEAVEQLAAQLNIEVTYEGTLSKEDIAQRKATERERQNILLWAEDWYHQSLLGTDHSAPVWQQLAGRGVTLKVIERWKLGYAPDNFHNISRTVAERGWQTAAGEIGLINTSKTPAFDNYKARIMIPMRDDRGTLLGFTGRDTTGQSKAKYYNPKESDLYKKSEQLFGLWQAKEAIRETGVAYLVEGHFDAIAMHSAGVENTVATGGTELTGGQLQKLKKQGCSHLVVLYDGDAAGRKATSKAVDQALKHDMRVEVIMLPEGQDPDSWIRSELLKEIPETTS